MAGTIYRIYESTESVPSFLSWAKTLSDAIGGAGWVKTSDTGQINWATQVAYMTITQVSAAGTTATYTYSGVTGASLVNGMWITVQGCTTAAFNVSGAMANLNTGTSTFTLTIASTTATEAEASASATAISGADGVRTGGTGNNYVYEIWRMNDAAQSACPVLMRIEYWNRGNTNGCPGLGILIGQASNGAGTLYGGMSYCYSGSIAQSTYATTVAPKDLWFNGGNNWLGFVWMRESGATQGPTYFAVERSKDNNGNDTSDYVTYVIATQTLSTQQTMFKPGYGTPVGTEPQYSWVYLMSGNYTNGYGNNNGCSPIFPWVGKADNPMISTVITDQNFGEGATVNMTLYNTSHSYLITGAQYIGWAGSWQTAANRGHRNVGLRWD